MKCIICGSEIMGTYLIDEWGQSICNSHKLEHCYSCSRFVKPSDFHSSDGRCLCQICTKSVVENQKHIEWVKDKVDFIFKSHEIDNIPTDIPIKLITPVEMAQIYKSNNINIYQQGLTKTTKRYNLLKSELRHTIYILTLLPKILFAGVLAHELLHVWQNEKGINLSQKYSEGICNLGSYIVYNTIKADISEYLIKKLKEDPDKIYGDGFREVFNLYNKLGTFKKTIEFITKKI